MMRLYVEGDANVWNTLVEASPYSVWHHKYEAFPIGKRKRGLPLVFHKGRSHLLFPFTLEILLGSKIATVPVYDLASVLPGNSKAVSLLPEALDVTLNTLRSVDVDLLTISAPFFMPKDYRHLMEMWFEKKSVLTQTIFVDALYMHEKSFEEIWMNEFSKHARNRARKAEKEGVCIHEIENLSDWISDMYLCNMSSFHRQKRYPRYPHSNKDAFLTYLDWHKKLLEENFKIYGAFSQNRLIAYVLTSEFNKLIVISLWMSLSEFLMKCPNDALMKYLIDHACKDGFEWICYSFDRMSYSSEKRGLHSSLRRFKFEHGFEEYPMKIYSLRLTRAGTVLQEIMSMYNRMFILGSRLPRFATDALQKIYERGRYRKPKYKYIKDDLQHGRP